MQTRDLESYVTKQIQASPKLAKLLHHNMEGEEPMLLSFAVAGMSEETGEVSGLVCRELYKGIQMPREKWVEELGDALWYVVAATLAKGLTIEDLLDYNKNKLEERYGKV